MTRKIIDIGKTQRAIDPDFVAKALGAERIPFMVKVVSDPMHLKDIFDIAHIEESKKVKGKTISAKEYFEKRRAEEKASQT
jgi:hypothetical protein